MVWKCPACGIDIRHEQDAPRRGPVYRCHVCRLELILDPEGTRLTVAPLPTDKTALKEKSAPG